MFPDPAEIEKEAAYIEPSKEEKQRNRELYLRRRKLTSTVENALEPRTRFGTPYEEWLKLFRETADRIIAQHNDRFLPKLFSAFTKAAVHPYLMRYVLYENEPLFIYGQPGEGKTHVAVSIATALGYGERWNGSRVNPCVVIYLAYERKQDVEMRFQVVKEKLYPHRGDDPLVFIAQITPKIKPGEFLRTIKRMVSGLRDTYKCELPVVIFIDTLRRAMIGDVDKSTDTQVLFDAVKEAQDELGITPAYIYHQGKDPTKGLTGSINIEAVATTVMLVSDGEAIIEKCSVDKEAPPFAFTIEVVDRGRDEDGEPVTAAYALFANPHDGKERSEKFRFTGWAKWVYEKIAELRANGVTVTRDVLARALFEELVKIRMKKDPNWRPHDYNVGERSGNTEKKTAGANVSKALKILREDKVIQGDDLDIWRTDSFGER